MPALIVGAFLFASFPVSDTMDFIPANVCLENVDPLNFPAVPVIYDPAGGGINCDGDCGTLATGPMRPEYYKTAAACPAELLGATVHIPYVGDYLCRDTGGMICSMYSPHFNRVVTFIDVLWPIEDMPAWVYWLRPEWTVTWEPWPGG